MKYVILSGQFTIFLVLFFLAYLGTPVNSDTTWQGLKSCPHFDRVLLSSGYEGAKERLGEFPNRLIVWVTVGWLPPPPQHNLLQFQKRPFAPLQNQSEIPTKQESKDQRTFMEGQFHWLFTIDPPVN